MNQINGQNRVGGTPQRSQCLPYGRRLESAKQLICDVARHFREAAEEGSETKGAPGNKRAQPQIARDLREMSATLDPGEGLTTNAARNMLFDILNECLHSREREVAIALAICIGIRNSPEIFSALNTYLQQAEEDRDFSLDLSTIRACIPMVVEVDGAAVAVDAIEGLGREDKLEVCQREFEIYGDSTYGDAAKSMIARLNGLGRGDQHPN